MTFKILKFWLSKLKQKELFFHFKSLIKKVETTLFYSISSYEIHRITCNYDELLVKKGLISLEVKSRAPYCGVLSHYSDLHWYV